VTTDRPHPTQVRIGEALAPRTEGAEVTVEGTIEHVYFSNPDTGWSAVRLALDEGRQVIRAAGLLAEAKPGDPVRVRGRWSVDPKWGKQLQVAECERNLPQTLEGIRRYLGSGMVPGIGPQFASRLVRAFGLDTLKVIAETPERLSEVEGIGPKRAAAIRQNLAEQGQIQKVMVFLQGHGLSPAKALRIHKRYGGDAIRLIEQNPYRLAEDIFGIGFSTADRIAESLGVPRTSPFRLQAGLGYALSRAADEGQVFLPEAELTTRAATLLGQDETRVAAEVPALVSAGLIIADPLPGAIADGGRALYLPHLHAAEREAAARIRTLLETPARPALTLDAGGELAAVEARLGLALAPAQARAVQAAITGKVVVITGGPGTGKTTILRAVLDLGDRHRLQALLAAPTGRAAKRMQEATGRDARTLHRLLEYQPGAGGFQRGAARPLEADLVVVDEVSMLDTPLLSALLRAVPSAARLVLVGDADQLPSVGPGAVLAQLIACGRVPVVRLTEVFRQAARSQIVMAAHQVNQGQMLEPPAASGAGELYVVEQDSPERAAELMIRIIRERIPPKYGLDPVADVQVLSPTRKGATGTLRLNQLLQAELNPGGEQLTRGDTTYRVGDKVMQVRNDYDRDVYNGDLGRVSGIDLETRTLRVLFENRLVAYEPADLDELVPAYACTVHKSQGSEYPAVVMPLFMEHFMLLQRNLLYTAITRARKLFVLVGERRAIRRAIQNDEVRLRYTALGARIRGEI
jgi:exodeoxyribonuclease V alpha subunit